MCLAPSSNCPLKQAPEPPEAPEPQMAEPAEAGPPEEAEDAGDEKRLLELVETGGIFGFGGGFEIHALKCGLRVGDEVLVFVVVWGGDVWGCLTCSRLARAGHPPRPTSTFYFNLTLASEMS